MADEAQAPAAKAPTATKQAVKPTPLRDDFEKKVGALQRKKKTVPKYNDYEDDEDSSEPEFAFPHRQGKHRITPVRQSRIADRPQSGKEPTMSIKIELDLEVEVEIYASASYNLIKYFC
jgi:hypothetical protein